MEEKVEESTAVKEKKPTKREKSNRQKKILIDLLGESDYKWNELLKIATEKYESLYPEEKLDIADVKGKFGSIFAEMEKGKKVQYDKSADRCFLVKKERKTRVKKQKEEKTENIEKAEKVEPLKKEKKEEKGADFAELIFLGNSKKQEEKKQEEPPKKEEKVPLKSEAKKTPKIEKKPTKKAEKKELTLKDKFLNKLRSLGGKYFEYYSVYLLERHSFKNGRRVEMLRISGGENDGGIDGELELTDKFGFREVIYIQSKNWDDSKGKDKWIIKQTDFQQFIGAVSWRATKEGKKKCRGIFITTSHFHDAVKEVLRDMDDEFVAYDADDVFEVAKECQFGLLYKDGKWEIDEKLLSSEKAFFEMF